ncbi:unnamed protein product, partial [Vitis vinifera]
MFFVGLGKRVQTHFSIFIYNVPSSDFSITEIAFIPSPRKSFPSKQTRRVNSVPSLPQQETLVCRELLAMADTRKHTALLVVDMQKDFLDEDRPISLEGGKAIIPSAIKAVEVARELGILVVWVVREHDPQGRDVEVFRRNFYGPGKLSPATKGSEGAELIDGLAIKEGDYKLVKTRFSAFFATHLHSLLQSNGINSVVVVGVQTPNCIRQTAFDAVSLDYQSVTVIVDATAAATPDIHLANILDMKNVGVATPTLQKWCQSNA